MPIALTRFQSQLFDLWTPLGRGQKITLGIVGLLTLAVLAFFGLTSTQTTYATAFSKLGEQDAGTIIAKLKELKIPFELADGGSTVKVPSSKVSEVRIQLAQAGIPKTGTVGFEIFDGTNFGLTDFNQKLNYQRGLEGELSRTISGMSAVEQAVVHLVLPKPELFSDKAKAATASVTLKLKPGARLDSSGVRSISNIVSASVEGLTPENISIVDVNGNILWDEKDSGTASGQGSKVAQSFLDAQARFERDTEIKIQSMLDKVFGVGKVTTKVAAVMDWDQVQINRESFGQGTPRSQREVTERVTGPGSSGGIPGVAANLSGGGAGSTVTNTNTIDKRDVTTNYELTKTVESILRAPGSVKKLSVAVFVDNLPDPAGVQAISQAVSNAAGLVPDRGDTITVSNVAFDRSLQAADKLALENSSKQELYLLGAKTAGIALSLIVAMIFVRSMFRTGKQVKIGAGGITVTDVEDDHTLTGGSIHSRIEGAIASAELGVMDEEAMEEASHRVLQDQIITLARVKPHTIAQVLQQWIEQDD